MQLEVELLLKDKLLIFIMGKIGDLIALTSPSKLGVAGGSIITYPSGRPSAAKFLN